MPTKRQHYFCGQLTDWLYATEWHYTTLLSVSIDSVKKLPGNADNFINCLLLSHPKKPSYQQLSSYISGSKIIESWFRDNLIKPSIRAFNLDALESESNNSSDLPRISSVTDLANWLNISLEQLDWLTDLKRVDEYQPEKFSHYCYSLVKKRRGGMRLIESPKTKLKEAQTRIYSDLLSKISTHSSAHGFRKNYSCVSHAKNHTNQQYLFTFDLANYFHSIDWYRVYKIFRRLGYCNEISTYLGGLSTHRFNGPNSILQNLDKTQVKKLAKRHLAQGAPTSPAISNLVMYKLDKRLDGLADSLNLNYSRYADDLAFSGSTHRDWRFLEPLIGAICLEEGFELNYRKSRVVRAHQRQKITGVVVNQGTNIDRRYYDNLKAILTNCIRYGAEKQNIEQHNNFQAHLLGRIKFVDSLNKSRGEKLLTLYQKIEFT